MVGCVGGCLIKGNRTEVGSVSFGRVASFDHIFRVRSLGELKKKKKKNLFNYLIKYQNKRFNK